MSTNKLLQSLSEDPQLEKQIGCMAGILQLFDRHQVLTGRRLYGHKRIAATASKTQTPSASNCGSPSSDSSGILNENAFQNSTEQQRQKHAPTTGVVASSEQHRSQPLHTQTTPTEAKSSLAFSRTSSLPANDVPTAEVNGRDQLPKISFEMARSSLLAPRRLDSSRSLHEARVNVAHDSTKIFARKSVDTAERAAAAARGALKELSRISTDFTGPSPHEDQVSIRNIVRSSLGQDHQAPRSSNNVHSSFAPRMSNEASTCAPRASLPRDTSRVHNAESSRVHNAESSRVHNAESKSTSEFHSVHASHTSTPQAGGRVEASRPPRHSKLKVEIPQKSCADISESLRLLAKLREASPTSYNSLPENEGAEDANGSKYSLSAHHAPQQAKSSQVDLGREGQAFSSRASLPRVASDRLPGRMSSYEPSRASSVDSLLHPKGREGPRLSLDGRVAGGGIKADREMGSQSKLHPRTLLTSKSVSCSNSDCDTESLHEKRASFTSNVVAKLMGLDEMPNGEAHSKLGLSASSDQKSMRASTTVMQDVNPTFTQCGNYVSASFFPSRQGDDIKITVDSEEGEEESDLHLKSLSHQDARTLNVRVGSLKSQGGDRLVISENGSLLGGHTCYQPKNHHLIEDRPPHVLSPAARLCAQIEEMQRADSVYKDFDKDTRTLGLPQSSKPELEALKQLLGAIQLKKEYAKSCVEKFPMGGLPRKLQPESGWMPFPFELHPQAEQPSAVTWNTKRMLNDEFDSHMHENNVNTRRNSSESRNRNVKNGSHERALHLPSRQHMLPENYNQGPPIRADAYISPGSTSSSMCNTPRKSPLSSDFILPGGTQNVHATPMKGARRMVVHPHSSPNGQTTKISTPPRTPMNQQMRLSNNGGSSWEVSSVSSTSSSNAREHHVSSYRATNKQKKESERGLGKKTLGILKDKEESKANLVSLKPSPVKSTEKKAKSGGVASSANSRTSRKPIHAQNDNLRSSMRTPTRSVARKEVDVKRKLSFSNRSASGLKLPSESSVEDEEADFVDKTIVSSIEIMQLSKSSLERNEAGHHIRDPNTCMSVGSRENDLGLLVNTPSINRVRTEAGGAKGPLLLVADDANALASTLDGEVTSTIFERDAAGTISPICTPTGALRLPQVLQQENEDTESQGDKSTGSCEQPSPISVLEGPFYEDDVASPPTTTKFVLKLEELEEEARAQASAGSSSPRPSPFLTRDDELQSSLLTDFEYVKHLVQISCAPQVDAENACNVWKLRPLDSHYFLQLEEQVASNDAASMSELGSTLWRRKMLFDSVNASLETRLHAWRLCQHQPWLLACERGLHGTIASGCSSALRQGIFGFDEENNVCLSNEGGKVLLEEVWEEIEANTKTQRGIVGGVGTSVCEGEEVDGGACDEVGRMLEEDIMGRSQRSGRPDMWATLLVEKGELGLDLERLIFKDLVDHTIRDLGLLRHPPHSLATKRQLFKLHN